MATEQTPLLPSLTGDNVKLNVSKQSCSTKGLVSSGSKEYKRNPIKRLVTVEPVVLLVLFTNCANSVTIQYIYQTVAQGLNYTYSVSEGSSCDENTTAEETKEQQAVQEAATVYTMINLAIHILPIIFASVLIGPYTDKAGRKYGLIPQMCFLTLQLIFHIIIVAAKLPLYYFFLSYFIGGLAGGESCIGMTCIAYIADITTSEERTIRIFVFQSVLMLGGTIFLLGVSILIIYLGFLNTYLCILGCYIPIIIYTIFFLPESVIASSTAKLFSFGHLKGALKLYARKTDPPRTVKLAMFVIITVLAQTSMMGAFQTATLYFFNMPFCWNTLYVNLFLAVSLLAMGLGGLIFIPLSARCLKEEGRILLGSVFGIMYFLAFGLAFDTTTAFLVPVFGVLFNLVSPMAKSAATKLVEPHEQGQLQATINPLEQTVQFFSSWINSTLYAVSLTTLRGLQYFVLAGNMVVVLILAMILQVLKFKVKEKLAIISEKVVEESDFEEPGFDSKNNLESLQQEEEEIANSGSLKKEKTK